MKYGILAIAMLFLSGAGAALAQDSWFSNENRPPDCPNEAPPVRWSDCLVYDFDRREADFSGSSLTQVEIDESNFDRARFPGVLMTGVSVDESLFRNVDFSNAEMRGFHVDDSVFNGASFRGADLRGAHLEDSRFENADFRNANLEGAVIDNIDFEGTNFSGAIWTDGRRCGEGSIGECR